MSKKILMGSMLVLTLLLLMPSIPAIHINAIENQIKTEYEELPLNNDINFKIPDKYPLLYLLVLTIGWFKAIRGVIYCIFSIKSDDYWPITYVDKPILFFRGITLLASGNLWIFGWYIISKILGWNWELYDEI